MGDFQKRRQSWHTFFKVMVETQVVLGFSHVWVAYWTNQRQWRLQRSRNESQKRPEKANKVKRVIFKGDGSLDAFFSRFLERLNVFWIPHMSGYLMDLMKPIRDNEDFKGAFRNVKNGPKMAKKVKRVIFKGVVVLTHLFHGYGSESSCSGLLTCQGNPLNQSEKMRTSKDPSGITQMAKKWPKGWFSKKPEVLVHFS